MSLTEIEIEYLRGQRLGRFVTLGPDGEPQARPVGVHLGPGGTIDVYGWGLTKSQKWRNVHADPRVSFVVDDLASVKPWRPRGVEFRGTAETLTDDNGDPLIRIHPSRILSWGLEEGRKMYARDVA